VSFAIGPIIGRRDAVREYVMATKVHSDPYGDLAKQVLGELLDATPDVNIDKDDGAEWGVSVSANGHTGPHGSSVALSVGTVRLAVEQADDAGDQTVDQPAGVGG
jgi:hypothetical protein